MAAHDLINAAVKANESAMRTAIKNGYPVQLPANQYLPKAMNGNIDLIHLGQFADLDAGFDDYRKQQAAQQAQAANQDFSDLDAGFAEWSAGQGGANVESMRISPVEAPKTAPMSTGGQSTGSRSGSAYTGRGTAQEEIPSLDNMAVPVTAKDTTKAEKTAAKEVKQTNSALNKADKALKTAQKKQTVAENNLRKKLDRAENEAQKADAMRNAAKVTKRGNTTVIEPAQNVQQTKRKMQNLAKEEARAQAEYTKAHEDVRKAEKRAKKAADRQQAANDRAQAVSAFAARRTANSGTVSSGIVLDNDSPIQQLESTMPQSTPVTWNQPTQQTVPEISALQQAVRADALKPKTATMLTPAQAREMGLVPDEVIGQGGQPGTTVNAFTDQDMRTVWANPDYKLDDEEYARAKKMSEDYFKQNFRGPNDRYFVGNPADQTDGTVEEMSRIYNKTHQGAAFTGGVLNSAAGVGKIANRGAVEIAERTGQDDLADALTEYGQQMDASIAGARTQHPVTSTLGTMAGKAAQYAATNPYFDSIAEASGLTGAAKFALNQGAQLAQDYAVSDLPQLYEDLSNEDLTTQQALRNLGVNTLQDAAGNLAMGALSDYIIPKLTGRGAVESAGDAARAVSNTPAPVDDSVDAALFGTGIMQDLNGADIPSLGEADDYILGGLSKQADDVADAVRTADAVEDVADAAKAVDAVPEASESFDPYELAHKKLRSNEERQWLIDNNSYQDDMALSDLNDAMTKRGHPIFNENGSNEDFAFPSYISDAVHDHIARGDFSPEAYAQAFDELSKDPYTDFKPSDIVVRAYEIDGKELPESLRRQYYRTAEEKLADAQRDLDYARSIKKAYANQPNANLSQLDEMERRALAQIDAIRRGDIGDDEIPSFRSIAEDAGIPELTDEVGTLAVDGFGRQADDVADAVKAAEPVPTVPNESPIAQEQWDQLISAMSDTEAAHNREGADVFGKYIHTILDYEKGNAGMEDVDEAFRQAQYELQQMGMGVDDSIHKIINPDYRESNMLFESAYRQYNGKYPEAAGAYRQAQKEFDEVLADPNATRDQIIEAGERVKKTIRSLDGKVKRGESAGARGELGDQLAELRKEMGATGEGKTIKVYADPKWADKEFGYEKRMRKQVPGVYEKVKRGKTRLYKHVSAQDRLKGTGITLVDDPKLATGGTIYGKEDLRNYLSRAMELQGGKKKSLSDVKTDIGKYSDEVVNMKVNEALESRGFERATPMSEEELSYYRLYGDEEGVEAPDNWQSLFDEPAPARSMEEAVDEIPSVQSIAEDTGIPNQTDEVLNIGADEIPSATRQAEPIPTMSAEEAVDNGIPALADEAEEVAENAFKLSKESADELQAEVKRLRKSFVGKTKYIHDQNNEYALAFLDTFDRFSKDPTPETYAEARSALNEYVDHSNTVRAQAWNGEWYDRKFDNSSMSESFIKRFDELAEKYGFKTSDAAEEIPALGKTADGAASTANQADVAGKVADATRATNADAVPGSGARTAEAVNSPDEPNIPLGEKERGFAKSSRKKGLIDDEIKAKITDRPLTYKQLSNKTTAERARQLFADTETFDDGERILKGLIDDNDAAATMYAKDLINAYTESGQTEAAMKVMDQISTALTKRGQFTQAAVLALAKDDPMTALQYVQKELDKLNADGLKRYGKKWKDFSLTEEELKLFENIKPGDEEAIKAAYDQIGKRIGREFPSTLPEKWMEARRIAMLLNVRTNIRNIGANIPTAGMRTMADRVEAVGQHIYKLWNPDFEITQSVTGNLPGSKFRRLAADIFNNDERMQLFRDAQRSKYNSDLAGGIMDNRQVFHANALEKFIDQSLGGAIQKFNAKAFGKEGVQSGAETLRNLTYKLLDIGDSPFVRENFVDRLASYMKAQGIEDAAQVPDEAIAIAWEEAMKATYKDDSWMNAVVGGAKKSIAKIPFGIGKPLSEGLIPFVQAPANIGARMVDYSVLGGGKGVADLIKGAKAGDDVLVRKGIEEMSKGLTGTGLAYLGYKLHQSGLLTGSYSDNKRKREAQQEHGFKEWALHIGDRYYTYDWAQPFAQSLIAGTIIADAIEKSDEANYALLDEFGIDDPKVREAYAHIAEVGGVSKDIGKALVNSWFNASPLNSLSGFMGSSSYGWKADIGSGFEDTARNFVTSFIPSLSGAIARGTDTTVRATKDGRSDAVTLTNQIKAKIPGLSKTLPAAYDAWGREKTRGDSVQEAMISQNLIPGETGIERLEPYEEEAARLADAMEDDALYPFVADYVVGDKKLSTKEREEYQHVMGDRSREIVEALMATEAYQTMDDSQKAEAFKAIYSASKSMAENQLFSKDIAKANQKLAQAYADGGAEGAANFLTMKTAINDAGLRVTENNQKIYDEYGQEGIQQLIELTDQFDAVKQARKDSGLDNNINIMTTLEMLNGSEGNAQLILDGLAKSNQLDPEKFEQRSDGSWVYNQKEGTTLELTDTVGVEAALAAAQQQAAEEIPVLEEPVQEEPIVEEPTPAQQTNVEINPATGRPVAPTRQTAQTAQAEPAVEIDPRTGRPKAPTRSGEAVQGEIPKLEPNGNATWNNDWEIEKSKSWGRFRQIDPSYTTSDYARVYNAMDKDKNGKLKSAEIQSYLNAMNGVDDAYRWAMFNAFANQGWGNPYKK